MMSDQQAKWSDQDAIAGKIPGTMSASTSRVVIGITTVVCQRNLTPIDNGYMVNTI